MSRDHKAAPDSGMLSAEHASVFLKLGIAGPRRPIDDLIDEINRDATGHRLTQLLEAGPFRGMGSAERLLLEGESSLEEWSEIKERSKLIAKQAATADERLAGMAGYFVSIAAALHHHQVLLTTRDRETLEPSLLDLADACQEPFKALLSSAALSRHIR